MHLILVGPSAVTRRAIRSGGRWVLGRARDADVFVDDRQVSREHVRVTFGAHGETTVEDLGSRNGTLLDGARLSPHLPASWSPGATCSFGHFVAWLEEDGEQPSWVDGAAFEARTDSSHDVFAVRPHGSIRTETSRAEHTHLETLEENAMLRALYRGLRSALRGSLGSDRALVTRGATGRILVALPRSVAPPALLDEGTGVGFELVPHEPGAGARAPVSGVAGSPQLDLNKVATSDVTVLVVGETGAGKEIMARQLHERSSRASRRFVVVNCAAIAESLFESELFGHERGAFTGAVASRPGYLESADGGTVFLDEIAELARPLQAKLLRVFEDRSVQRVGAVSPRPIDVRFIAATHRDLATEVSQGRFREDLYFRLCGVVLRVPPLRQRRHELPDLARVVLARLTADSVAISDEALRLLLRHEWPGNVRELRAVLERALLLRDGEAIEAHHLVFEHPASAPSQPATGVAGQEERRLRILAALDAAHGNQTKAAARLGISRRTLTNWLNELGLPRPRKGP